MAYINYQMSVTTSSNPFIVKLDIKDIISRIIAHELLDSIINSLAAEYQGKKVKLNDPIRNPAGGKKKFRVYVKDPKTKKVKKVQFGDPKMDIIH